MQKQSGQLVYSPSDLNTFFKSPFASWMDRFALELPEKAPLQTENETLKLLAKKGDEHERNYLQVLKTKCPDLVEIQRSSDFNTSHQQTVEAMKNGVSVIFQGALKLSPFQGYSDFLVKKQGQSNLGNYYYEVWDTKLSRHVKPEYSLQLCAYSEMLFAIQGIWPKTFSVVLGDNTIEELPTEDFRYYYLRMKNKFLDFQNSFTYTTPPTPQPSEEFGKWEDVAEKILREKDHLSFIAGINISQIKKMEQSGITTLTALSTTMNCPTDLQKPIFDKLKTQSQLQLASKEKGLTQFQIIKYRPDERFGLARLPPPNPGDVFFDMEGYPLLNGGLEYLFGATFLKSGQPTFIDWWALNQDQEKQAFENWIDWVTRRWKDNPGMHIYHYAAYEVTAMKKLMGKYMTREHEIDQFLRHGIFIDLYRVVKEGFVIGEESYSIKKLEGLYNFKRQGDVKKAVDSVVQFATWLESPDGDDWKSSITLKEIRDYNEEDCNSTFELFKWLNVQQKNNDIQYTPSETTADPSALNTSPSESEIFALQMMANLPADQEQAAIQKILAGLIGYHRREAKPQWWAYFERLNSIPTDLVDDLECLADCKIQSIEGKIVNISFNPQQETKLKEGSKVHDLINKKNFEITKLNIASGTAALSGKAEILNPRSNVTFIPSGPISTETMENVILGIAKRFYSNPKLESLRPCLKTFLNRELPRISNHPLGQDLIFDADNVDSVYAYVENLNQSTLAIQGPPGTGKTYTASHLIAYLLTKGKRIGITSNGHKAINNLMEKTFEVLHNQNRSNDFSFYKVGGTQDPHHEDLGIQYVKSTGDFWKTTKPYNLVGGTSWFFSAENSANRFDYLFIEEAGQFSLANCVACSASTHNLVLLGDQMQLEQPIQGTHPDDIAESALGYYLKGHATVPANMGIFLGVSRRMHPNVCQFISESIYESRLSSHENTASNLIKANPHPLKEAGIVFIPVEHEGNTQGSIEEAKVISDLIDKLKNSTVETHGPRSTKFNINSCLFISPFNMQVGLLKSCLGEPAKIGSVDLFQGLEAPIVFISMCSSSGDISPRGLEFLLNKNRLNVAISRAQSLAVIVGSSALAESRANSIDKIKLLNLFCKIISN